MLKTAIGFASLLIATAILLLGTGLLTTALPLRATAEGFSASRVGMIMAGYYLGFIIGASLCPRLVARVGHIRTFAGLAALNAAVALLHGLFVVPLLWLVLRAVSGICMIGLYVVIESWITGTATADSRGRLFAVYMTVNLLALAAGQFLIVPYGVETLKTFVIAGVFINLALIPVAFTRIKEPPLPVVGHAELGATLRQVPMAMAGALATGLGNGAFWLLGPVFVKLAGGGDAAVATFMAAVIVGGALLQLPVGYYSDRHDRRYVLLVVTLGAALAAAWVLPASSESLLTLAVAGFFFGGFACSIYSLCVARAVDLIAPEAILGTTRSLLLVHSLGALVAPIFAGVLIEFTSHRALFGYISTVYLVCGIAIAACLRSAQRVPVAEQGQFVPVTRTSSEALDAIHVPDALRDEVRDPDDPVDRAEQPA